MYSELSRMVLGWTGAGYDHELCPGGIKCPDACLTGLPSLAYDDHCEKVTWQESFIAGTFRTVF
jgi:hypothetical protein